MDKVSLADAVSRWWTGDPTLRDALLGPLKVLYWGRIGKVLAMISSVILVVDYVGEERLRKFSRKRATGFPSVEKSFPYIQTVAMACATFLYMVALIAQAIFQFGDWSDFREVGSLVLTYWGFILFIWLLRRMFLWTFRSERVALVVRTTSFLLLGVGFTLDMLAS